jgi:MOSC domain-containing protein YiiM
VPTLISVQVGLPQERNLAIAASMQDAEGKKWTSGIYKTPVSGPVWVGALNLEGDGQADLISHGGPDRAALLYCAEHYDYWRETLPDLEWVYGGFGENFTVSGLDENTACLGDIYAIGDVRIQVSQPRQPCWKLARRWKLKDLAARVERNGYSGWYVRVLQEGNVEAGMPIELIECPFPQWTITQVRNVADNAADDLDLTRELSQIQALSEGWREGLAGLFDN